MKKFHTADLIKIKEAIKEMNDQELLALSGTEFKDPTISLVLSILVGGLGVDRFYIGDIGAGVGKLLTAGGLGIWWIIDLFNIQKKTKTNNAEDLNETLMLNQIFLAQ
ncbi:MAG: TM2 domain-containing protein [Bacteroidales bacterium]|nr:TM2 domain-containing protein [Bacteroidales bacterium]